MADNEINTNGGTVIGGGASAGRDVIGRDSIATHINLSNLERLARWLAAAVVLGVLIWAVVSLVGAHNEMLATERLQAEARQLEASRPFLERQLALYTEAAQVAGVLATSEDEAEQKQAEQRFWQLYWSEMVMVEDGRVEGAMKSFGTCVEDSACVQSKRIEREALTLACAFRASLADSWGVTALAPSLSCQ